MYCLGTAAALVSAFALYQVVAGLRDLRFAARLREGEATPVDALEPGGARIVAGTAQPHEGLRSPLDGAPLAWLRARLARLPPPTDASHRPPPRILLDHESEPLRLADATGVVEVHPRRAHDALPRPRRLELDDGLPPELERALRALGLEEAPPGEGALLYEEHRFEPGERTYAVGRVAAERTRHDGGAYRGGPDAPARLEDAAVSRDAPAGLARPYRARGLLLLLGGLVLGGLGVSMLAVLARALVLGAP